MGNQCMQRIRIVVEYLRPVFKLQSIKRVHISLVHSRNIGSFEDEPFDYVNSLLFDRLVQRCAEMGTRRMIEFFNQ